jgi:adenylylsulfate kinase
VGKEMKILIMGLPGAGKTWIAERLVKSLDNCAWFNADVIRGAANDWDFTPEGRLRQSQRMRAFSDFENNLGRTVICDFIAPTEKIRTEYNPDITIWVDTIWESGFADTNAMFEKPASVNYHITHYMSDEEINNFAKDIMEDINV